MNKPRMHGPKARYYTLWGTNVDNANGIDWEKIETKAAPNIDMAFPKGVRSPDFKRTLVVPSAIRLNKMDLRTPE